MKEKNKTKARYKINGFKYPSSDKLTSRTSTICRSMACTLLSRDACSEEVEKRWSSYFPNRTCAYCGKPASHLDHLYALINDRKPTGYCTEPSNLVPCCKDCNQPKGNTFWEDFMRSEKCHHVGDSSTTDPQIAMENRISTMKQFQADMPPRIIILNEDAIAKWNRLLEDFDNKLREAQDELIQLSEVLYSSL